MKRSEITESSIERWCERWESPDAEKMDNDLGYNMLRLMAGSDALDMDSDFTRIISMTNEELQKSTDEKAIEIYGSMIPIIYRRIKYCFDYEVTNSAIMYIFALCKTPADVTMYCTMLQYLCKKNKIWKVGLKEILQLFHYRFYSKDRLKTMWKNQKIEDYEVLPDNLLDLSYALKSIRK